MTAIRPSNAACNMAILHAQRKAQHQCVQCGCPLPEAERRKKCSMCLAQQAKASLRRYYRRVAQHRCPACGTAHTTCYVRCQACNKRNRKYMRKRKLNLRKKVSTKQEKT